MRFLVIPLIILSVTLSAQVKEYSNFDQFEEELLLPSNSDTTYIINFWATWCVPCVKELPYFEALSDKFKSTKNKVILVSLDFTAEQIQKFMLKKGIKNHVVWLSDGKTNSWINRIDSNWSGAIPITIFIKGKNMVFYEKDYESLKDLETDLLKFNTTKL